MHRIQILDQKGIMGLDLHVLKISDNKLINDISWMINLTEIGY